MEKLWTYISIITGMELLFYFAGISTRSDQLLAILLDLENFNVSLFWSSTLIVASLGSAIGITIGIVTKNVELAVMLPISLYISVLFFEFIKIYIYLSSLNFVLATLFFAPFIILFPLIIIEYWRGKD